MGDGPPGRTGGFGMTPKQKAVIRAVEEQALLDQVEDFLTRMNRIAKRLEAYVEDEEDSGERI